MAGLSSNTNKVNEKLYSQVVSQLNNIREGLNKQQQGIAMKRGAGAGNFVVIQCLDIYAVELQLLVLILQSTGRMPELKYMYLFNIAVNQSNAQIEIHVLVQYCSQPVECPN